MLFLRIYKKIFNMKKIPLFEEFITEKKGDSYSAGCVMLYFDFPQMEALHKLIEPDDIYTEDEDRTYGLEDEPHCTLLYGLDPKVTLDQVKEKVGPFKFSDLIAYNASLFENPKFDVLKFDMRYPIKGGSFLHKCNKALCELPYKSDFPDYHPHMTVAYIKPGLGKKYVSLFKDKEYNITPSSIVYSEADGTKTKIEI
jgi:2'-5' RNA ligase